MSNYVRYEGETGFGPSPIIFGDLAKAQAQEFQGKCILIYDNFQSITKMASVSASGGYYTYMDTNTTVESINTVDLGSALGVLRMTTGKDNEECGIQLGYGHNFRIDNANGNTGKVLFEARFRTNTIANNGVGFALGLGGGPVAADHLIDDTGEINNTAPFIGLQRLADDGDKADVFYTEASQAKVTVQANAITLAADTWFKFGFIYDPAETAEKKIKYFINSVEQSFYTNTTNIDTATFPEGSGMQPMVLAKPGANDQGYLDIDWIAAVQYRDGV